MQATKEQNNVIDLAVSWYREDRSSYLTIGGYAGTGKTTIISYIAKELLKMKAISKIAYCAFTGKAASVLKTKLQDSGVLRYIDTVGTLHQLMYFPETRKVKGRTIITGWHRKHKLDVDFIIIDEGSMVSKVLWKDVTSYGIPILLVGDHGQLSPIGDSNNLMQRPTVILKEIHRQALNNPIIKLSADVRKYGYIPPGVYGDAPHKVYKLSWRNPQTQQKFHSIDWKKEGGDGIVLCNYNNTRVTMNNIIRKKIGAINNHPELGERIICLKNNHESGIMNGQLSTVKWSVPMTKDLLKLTIKVDGYDDPYDTVCFNGTYGVENYKEIMERNLLKEFGSTIRDAGYDSLDLFDHGYATTVHKSQGSEWKKVVLIEQRTRYQDDREYARWLYTAITRAKEILFVIYDYNY